MCFGCRDSNAVRAAQAWWSLALAQAERQRLLLAAIVLIRSRSSYVRNQLEPGSPKGVWGLSLQREWKR